MACLLRLSMRFYRSERHPTNHCYFVQVSARELKPALRATWGGERGAFPLKISCKLPVL